MAALSYCCPFCAFIDLNDAGSGLRPACDSITYQPGREKEGPQCSCILMILAILQLADQGCSSTCSCSNLQV